MIMISRWAAALQQCCCLAWTFCTDLELCGRDCRRSIQGLLLLHSEQV